MGTGGLKKDFSRIDMLRRDQPVFDLLAADVAAAEVFPAVRDREMHFYHKGARLLGYETGFKTHSRYQCDKDKSKDTPAEYEPLRTDYAELKKRCADYRDEKSELPEVARLYQSLSHARRDIPEGMPTLLDVEVRFPGLDPAEPRTGPKKGHSDMIDMLFALPSGKLCFVEAKRTRDPRARARSGEPEVARQIRDYERQAQAVDHIVETYGRVQTVLHRLFGCAVRPLTGVFHKVPLLILGEWRPSRQERWQGEWLARSQDWSLDEDFILVAGGADPSRALTAFLVELDRRLA